MILPEKTYLVQSSQKYVQDIQTTAEETYLEEVHSSLCDPSTGKQGGRLFSHLPCPLPWWLLLEQAVCVREIGEI